MHQLRNSTPTLEGERGRWGRERGRGRERDRGREGERGRGREGERERGREVEKEGRKELVYSI